MSSCIKVAQSELERFVEDILSRLGVSKDDGTATAARMIKAHLRGFDTHGLPCLPGYVESLEQGRLNARPQLKIEQSTPWAGKIDGDNGLGHICGTRGMQLALEAAANIGIGSAVVKRSNHFGAASAYSMMALEQDCIGIVMSNASAVTAPFGAAEPLMGTNPLSVAIPAGKQPPFVIDMATSEGARKKVRKALEEGKEIPSGWSLDSAGEPTVDPAAALKGVMLPFGGPKGSAITVLIDIFSGVLSGAEFGGRVLSVATNQERESGNGNFMMAIKVDSFMEAGQFKERMDEELRRIRSLKPARGFEEVIYPGYRAHAVEQLCKREGIALDRSLVEKLQALANRLDVEFPG